MKKRPVTGAVHIVPMASIVATDNRASPVAGIAMLVGILSRSNPMGPFTDAHEQESQPEPVTIVGRPVGQWTG